MEKLLSAIKSILTSKLAVPKCFNDKNFLHCFCGRCKPKEYELPEDLQKVFIVEICKMYMKNHVNHDGFIH